MDQNNPEEIRKQLDSVLNTQKELICRFTPDTTLTYVNDAYCRAFGKTREELLGMPFLDLVPESEHEQIRAHINKLGADKITTTYEHQVITQNSGLRWQEWTDYIVSEENGKVTEFQSVGYDITERKKAEEALHAAREEATAASRAKSQFLANMSHEIRTPLSSVIGFISLMRTTPLNETQENYLNHAKVSAQTLLGIINNILDLSRIEAGKLELDPVISEIPAVCKEALDIIHYQAEARELDLTFSYQSQAPAHALVDPLRLKQVLVNLLANAVKFTDEGEVELKVTFEEISSDKGRFTFTVNDTGIGISEEEQKRLFKAFTQADNSISRKYGGTGLGLTISNLLAEMMGSHIELSSEPGKGSTFFFTIETTFEHKEKDKKAADATPSIIVLQSDHPPVVLLVEDDQMNREVYSEMITRIIPEALVREATNGQEAIDLIEAEKVDFVFMDLTMPGMDGFEATRAIRRHEKEQGTQKSMPIVALTVGSLRDNKDKCLEAGMDDFLTKPIDNAQLREVLVKHLVK